ncbi:hypothetical protein D3C75_1127170 [compost metagenome]
MDTAVECPLESMVTVWLAVSHLTSARSASATKRSGIIVLPFTVCGGALSLVNFPSIDASVELTVSVIMEVPLAAVICCLA